MKCTIITTENNHYIMRIEIAKTYNLGNFFISILHNFQYQTDERESPQEA